MISAAVLNNVLDKRSKSLDFRLSFWQGTFSAARYRQPCACSKLRACLREGKLSQSSTQIALADMTIVHSHYLMHNPLPTGVGKILAIHQRLLILMASLANIQKATRGRKQGKAAVRYSTTGLAFVMACQKSGILLRR